MMQKLWEEKKRLVIISGAVILLIFSITIVLFLNQSNKGRDLLDEKKIKDYLIQNYDNFVIDGSTTMVPLHETLNETFSSEERYVSHSKTVEAFEELIAGKNDILLGVDYSEELLAKAKESGIELEKLEITKEAFVFLINKNNPVQSLTIEQIKGIYSGEITNWKELGGDDAPISAYQRNDDSGSQMRMVMFMGDLQLIDKGIKYYPEMTAIIEAIANYDEGKYSIAYNMYTFVDKQFKNEEVVLLAVDGVYPTDETILDGTYPLVIYNYIYYNNKNENAREFAVNLHAYLMSEEGQKLLSDSGYINLSGKYERNKEVDLHYGYYDEFNTEEEYVDFYDKEKGEFYRVDWQAQKLITYYNYTDYVLENTQYENDYELRYLLETFFNSGLSIYQESAYLNSSETIIYIRDGLSYDPWLRDFIYIKYNGKYYNGLRYYIYEDKIELFNYDRETFDYVVEDSMDPTRFEKYVDEIDFDANVAITKYELSNMYFRSTYNEELDEYEYIQIFQ